MCANLGETKILEPLQSIFAQPLKGSRVRQLFVLTDAVLALVRENAVSNHYFAIAIGSGGDAGFVQ
jgi:hypothetical protein